MKEWNENFLYIIVIVPYWFKLCFQRSNEIWRNQMKCSFCFKDNIIQIIYVLYNLSKHHSLIFISNLGQFVKSKINFDVSLFCSSHVKICMTSEGNHLSFIASHKIISKLKRFTCIIKFQSKDVFVFYLLNNKQNIVPK